MRVPAGSSLVGRSVETAGLRALGDAFLVHVRSPDGMAPASPDTVLRGGDVLLFTGRLDARDRLVAGFDLEPTVEGRTKPGEGPGRLPVFEAVVAGRSPLVGRTLQEIDFRETYGGVVVGLRRRDAALEGALGRTPLQEGDLLLIEASAEFERRWGRDREAFYVVAPVRAGRRTRRPAQAAIALLTLIGVIGVSAVFGVSLVTTAFLGALVMIASGCLSWDEARRAVDLPVLLVIVAALGLGSAIESTGLAAVLGGGLTRLAAGPGRSPSSPRRTSPRACSRKSSPTTPRPRSWSASGSRRRRRRALRPSRSAPP